MISIVIDALGTIPKGLEKRLEEFEIRRRIETSNHIVKKSPGDLRRLAVTQTSV